jgi:hypothetical protein
MNKFEFFTKTKSSLVIIDEDEELPVNGLYVPTVISANEVRFKRKYGGLREFLIDVSEDDILIDSNPFTGTTAQDLYDAVESLFFLDDGGSVEWADLPFSVTQDLATFDRDVQFPNQTAQLGGAKSLGATNELLVTTNIGNGNDFNYIPEARVNNSTKITEGLKYVSPYNPFDKNSPQGQAQPNQTTTISSQTFTEDSTGIIKHYISVVIPSALGNVITYNWYLRSSTGFVNGYLRAFKSINLDPNSNNYVWSTATINDIKTFCGQPASAENVLINESASVNADIQIPLLRDGFFQKNGETLTFQLVCDNAFEVEAGELPDGQGGTFTYPYIIVDGVDWQDIQTADIDPNTGKIKIDLLPYSDEGKYRGLWNAYYNEPDLNILDPLPENGDFFYVSEAGTYNGVYYGLNDIIKYNGVDYDLIKDPNVQINDIVNAALSEYNVYVDSNYTGDVKTGSSLQPYTDLETAIANTGDGESILVLGTHVVSTTITLPSDKSLYFYGTDTTNIKYAAYVETNNNIFYQSVTNCYKEYFFDNIKFSNAGAYAVHVLSAKEVRFNGCEFFTNGWDGTGLSTILPENGTTLGYDSTQADLQAFYASSNTSDGGAMRIQDTTIVSVVDCEIYNNMRGLRIQDCGVGGYGYISRNQCYNNIESGIYLAASTYDATKGCENFTVYNNASKYNANNGILVVGGINNIVSLNIVEGNWNAGIMGWHVSNARFRDLDLTNNNRSAFNGIGNDGDASASITIAGNTARSERSFIADILATEVYNTGLGSNTSRIGFQILEDVQEITDDYGKTLINIDNVGFKDQDFAIDSLANLDVVKLTIGDCRFIDTTEKNVNVSNGSYYELPYSNHSTNLKECDFSVEGDSVILKEGINGIRLNPYTLYDLQAVLHDSDINIMLEGSEKIQFTLKPDGVSIDGVLLTGTNQEKVDELNALLQNSGNHTGELPTITSSLSITISQGDTLNYELTADYGVGYEWDLSNVPGVVNVEGNVRKLIGGSSLATGEYAIPVKAINYNGEDSEIIELSVGNPPFANTKSVNFNNNDWLGANAGILQNTLGRSSNGSGSSDAWSVSFWFKPGTATNAGQTILYFGNQDVVNQGYIQIKYNGQNNFKRLEFRYGSNNNRINLFTQTSTFTVGQWHHVLITYDGGTTGAASGSVSNYYSRFNIFIDGTNVNSSNINTNNNFGYTGSIQPQNFRIGRFNNGQAMRNNCRVDELAIWDSDQSSNISDIYNSGAVVNLTNLTDKPKHWWRMGDGDQFPYLFDVGTEANCIFVMNSMTAADIVNDVP